MGLSSKQARWPIWSGQGSSGFDIASSGSPRTKWACSTSSSSSTQTVKHIEQCNLKNSAGAGIEKMQGFGLQQGNCKWLRLQQGSEVFLARPFGLGEIQFFYGRCLQLCQFTELNRVWEIALGFIDIPAQALSGSTLIQHGLGPGPVPALLKSLSILIQP